MVKRSLPRRPSSFSSRRAAALPGEIETTEIPPFPVGFCRSTEELLGGSDARSLLAALDTPSPVSVRFNPYKVQGPSGQRISGNDPSVNPTGESVVVTGGNPIDSAPFSQGTDSGGTPLIRPAQLAGNEVPWCRYGYYLPQRPSFTLDPAFHAGAYYVQEAGSMFVERIFRQLFEPDTPLRILDLCAAPGGKTTLLSTLVGASGLVVANEVIRQRAGTLVDNVRKWGIGNTLVTNNDPSHFASLRHYFDLVLVDAPCSGEGMFRKTPGARTEWSEANVKLCAARGRRILGDVWEALRPGGILVYSTCTFNVQENEETVERLASEYDCEPVDVTADPAWGIVQGEAAGMATFRFFPHRVQSEGFFAAVLRKGDGRVRVQVPKPRKAIFAPLARREGEEAARWVGQPQQMLFQRVGENIHAYYAPQFQAVREISESLSVLCSGVLCGQLFGGKLRPEHSLALFHDVSRRQVPVVELSPDEAVAYLRKADISPVRLQEGINLVTFDGLPLGWIKRIGARSNNMYPKELRIVNL